MIDYIAAYNATHLMPFHMAITMVAFLVIPLVVMCVMLARMPAVPAVPAVPDALPRYALSATFFTDVPYTAIEWVAIEGEELRLEHPADCKPEWVMHTVTRGWFYRAIGPRHVREALAYVDRPILDTTVEDAVEDSREIDWDF